MGLCVQIWVLYSGLEQQFVVTIFENEHYFQLHQGVQRLIKALIPLLLKRQVLLQSKSEITYCIRHRMLLRNEHDLESGVA